MFGGTRVMARELALPAFIVWYKSAFFRERDAEVAHGARLIDTDLGTACQTFVIPSACLATPGRRDEAEGGTTLAVPQVDADELEIIHNAIVQRMASGCSGEL